MKYISRGIQNTCIGLKKSISIVTGHDLAFDPITIWTMHKCD